MHCEILKFSKRQMMESSKNFILKLTVVPSLHLVESEAFEEWGMDIPEVLLFAELGRGVVNRIKELSTEDKIYIFETIECGMLENENLKTLIATGLLEALFVRALRDSKIFRDVDRYFGYESRKYLLAWDSWHRGESDEY